jgi:hypothetical protein
VWIIIGTLIFLAATLPFTYNWVSKRGQYLTRLHSIGFQENDRGLIVKLEGSAQPVQDFFSSEPEKNVDDSKNPGFMYAAAGTTLLLPNAILGLYKYFVYRKRMRFQQRTYNQSQMNLLRQLQDGSADFSRLRDDFTKEFQSKLP